MNRNPVELRKDDVRIWEEDLNEFVPQKIYDCHIHMFDKKYVDIISRSIKSDKKLKANFILVKRYLDYKLSFLRLYNMSLDDLEREINLVID